MTISLPIRCSAACAAALFAASAVGQALPATAPTVATPQAGAAAPQTPGQLSAQRAKVDYAGGLLSITADNSSLNQILREVSRLTGMTITGGVAEERVYGSYGPDDTSTVLDQLLDGTGSNVMILFDDHQAPHELLLTPRNGGPTPPNPNASRERDEEDLPPQRGQRIPRQEGLAGRPQSPPQMQNPQQQTGSQGQPQPGMQPGMPTQQQSVAPTLPAPAVPDTTTQESPNGVKTPQQIYDQLMKMHQAQQPPAAAPQ